MVLWQFLYTFDVVPADFSGSGMNSLRSKVYEHSGYPNVLKMGTQTF